MQTITRLDLDRQLEIIAACHEAGIPLPLHPSAIVRLEDAGFTVDLLTGDVTPAAPDDTAAPTMAAYPMADVMTELTRMAVQRELG